MFSFRCLTLITLISLIFGNLPSNFLIIFSPATFCYHQILRADGVSIFEAVRPQQSLPEPRLGSTEDPGKPQIGGNRGNNKHARQHWHTRLIE